MCIATTGSSILSASIDSADDRMPGVHPSGCAPPKGIFLDDLLDFTSKELDALPVSDLLSSYGPAVRVLKQPQIGQILVRTFHLEVATKVASEPESYQSGFPRLFGVCTEIAGQVLLIYSFEFEESL